MKILIENSHIKGYHIYRVCPHKDIIMRVQKEEDNSYDPNSMIVEMPPLKDIPFSFLKEITRKAKGKEPAQFVYQTASKVVGRVPANLGKVLRKIEDSVLSLEW